jgi:hypothetical protein
MDSKEIKLESVTYVADVGENYHKTKTIEYVTIVKSEQEYMKTIKEKRENIGISYIFPGWYDKELDDETNFKRYNIYTGTHKKKICNQCGSLVKPKNCSQCKTIAYCSIKCQKIHWKKIHKNQCAKALPTM